VAVFTRRPGLVGATLAWWAAIRLRESRHTAPWSWCVRTLPAEMAVDAVTAAALVAGSVRGRRVVL
jgi:hypothetical protein